MKFIINILKSLHRLLLLKDSQEKRIKYLRRQGVRIGKNCLIDTMFFSTEPYLIEIGDHARIAGGTLFITHDGSVSCFPEEVNGGIFGKIKVGNNVFIGNNSIILLNTSIGNNCIIGAGSVVRGKFPENSVIIGNPAKVVLKMSMQRFLYLQNPNMLKTQNLPDSEKSIILKKHFGIE